MIEAKTCASSNGTRSTSKASITTDIYAYAMPGWQRQAADAFARAMEE